MESNIDKVRQRSRLAVYSTAAASAAAIAQMGLGVVVTSTGPGPVWSGSRIGLGTGDVTNLNWGDAVLNNKLVARIGYGQYGSMAPSFRSYSFRRAWVDVAGGDILGGRLASGATISAGLTDWGSRGGQGRSIWRFVSWAPRPAANASTGWRLAYGGQADSVRGFMAFRISAGGGDYYYGYFDLELSRDGDTNTSTYTMTVHGWAYESTLNQSITIGGASAVPGGAGLAALAFGAAGLRGRRRSRN